MISAAPTFRPHVRGGWISLNLLSVTGMEGRLGKAHAKVSVLGFAHAIGG